MITSMSNSRYFRIAIVIAAGIPNRTTIVTTWYAALVTQVWPAAMPSSAMTRKTASIRAVMASHLICSRCNGPPAWYRTTSDTIEAARNTTNATVIPVMVPTRATRRTGQRPATPSGFWKVSEVPPGAGICTSLGRTTSPLSVRPARTKPAAASGRQRRDGSFPDGKNRNMKAMVNVLGTKLHSASRPTSFGAGTAPGYVTAPITA